VNDRRWVAAAATIGLVLRLAFALLYWNAQPLTHDEREYLALARSLARGEGLHYPADEPSPGTGQRFGRAPGYPAFLALLRITQPAEHVPARVKIAQSAVGTLGILFIAAIARRAAGGRAAIAGSVIAAVYPPLVSMPAYALSETVYSTTALAAAWLLARSAGAKTVAVAAVVTAAAILIRPSMLFFVPVAVLWLWRRRRTSAGSLIFVLVTITCLLPWTVRNHRTYGRWIPVASEGGVTFWTGNHPLAIGEGDLAANPRLKEADIAFRRAHDALDAEALEPLYYSDALGWIRSHPAAWLALEARKLFFTVVPIGPSYALHSARYRIASAGSYVLLLPFAVGGAWCLLRRPLAGDGVLEQAVEPLWLMAAATVIAGLVFFPQERFRIPVIDPALIVSAAALAGLARRDEAESAARPRSGNR